MTKTVISVIFITCACCILCYIQARRLQEINRIFHANELGTKQTRLSKNMTHLASRAVEATSRDYVYDYSTTTGYMKSSLWCGDPRVIKFNSTCNVHTIKSKPHITIAIDDASWPVNEFNLGTYECPHVQCHLTARSAIHNNAYDAYVTALPPRKEMPSKITPLQQNVEISMENSMNYRDIKDFESYSRMHIDLVIRYRQPVAGIPWLATSYINTELSSFLRENAVVEKWNQRSGRLVGMAAFVTNCKKTTPDRLYIVEKIAKAFPVFKFGHCFRRSVQTLPHSIAACEQHPRRSAMWDAPKECVMHGVLFAFALENSIEAGYISEKLWQPLKMGAIPVYSVQGAQENRNLFPHPDAVLVIEDFRSIDTLTEYMRRIANNASLWYKHAMAWRKLPLHHISPAFLQAVNNSYVTLPCRLCELMHVNKGNVSRSHQFIQHSVLEPKLNGNTETTHLRQCILSEFENVWEAWPSRNITPSHPSKHTLGFDVIFIIHYTALKHRKSMMEARIREAFMRDGSEIPVVWIDVFDREMLSSSFLDQCAKTSTVRKYQKNMNNPHRENFLGEDSLTLKHLFAAYSFLRTPYTTNALILEDDATFDESGIRKSWTVSDGVYQRILHDLPDDYDILMLSRYDHTDQALKHKPRIGKHLVHAQTSRVASAYLLSRKGALNLLRSLPIVGPMDFQINYACLTEISAKKQGVPVPLSAFHDIKVFHSNPWMSDQLDTTGKVRSVAHN